MKIVLLFLSLLLCTQALATEEQIKFQNDSQKELYGELIKELRCPKCQNQNIADSNAVVAKDMRAKTKQLVEQGQDKEQVIDYMVNRYGQFAHYQPPLNLATSLLWLLPIVFISLAIFMLVKRSNNQSHATAAGTEESVLLLDDELESLLSKTEGEKAMHIENTDKTEGDK